MNTTTLDTTTTFGNRDNTEILRGRLADAEDLLRAIRHGEIDALVVDGPRGSRQVYTLHSAEEPYRNLVEQMQEGALTVTGRGDILYANAYFATLVGEPLETVVGSRIDRFFDTSGSADLETLLRAGSGRQRSRLIGSTPGALEVSLSLTTTTSAAGDRLNLIVTDLTELTQANDHRDRAERDNRTKDEFLAMLAHELRNPLGAISNAVRLLVATHAEGASTTGAEAVIARQIGHISFLIGELLDVERVVSGKIRLHPQMIDMAEAVRRAMGSFIGSDRHRIEVTIEPVWIEGDAVRLEQVLANLVTNAVKYTPPGGDIRVALRADGPDAVFSVEDTGAGISSKLLPFIFDPYVQAERTLDRAEGGLGIGLSLVHRLVELHGGTIEASSDGEGCGSRFTVRLKQTVPIAMSAECPAPAERRAQPRRVLLIEDNADARQMLRMLLELAGHVVYEAADGLIGLELVKAERPDVGIIDIGLPIMDGHQVARQIREEPHGREMLLLALSGCDVPEESRRSPEQAFDHHLMKPVDLDRLARLIGEQVGA